MMTLADRYLLYGWKTLKISLSLSAEPVPSPVTGTVHPEECPEIAAVCHLLSVWDIWPWKRMLTSLMIPLDGHWHNPDVVSRDSLYFLFVEVEMLIEFFNIASEDTDLIQERAESSDLKLARLSSLYLELSKAEIPEAADF
jgi:hypothetical protein